MPGHSCASVRVLYLEDAVLDLVAVEELVARDGLEFGVKCQELVHTVLTHILHARATRPRPHLRHAVAVVAMVQEQPQPAHTGGVAALRTSARAASGSTHPNGFQQQPELLVCVC